MYKSTTSSRDMLVSTVSQTFYFYDLETSGINARTARIMQFAGQRTDMDLQPIGEPDNIYIKLSPDILPEPDAVMVTGITPQKTLADGITEAEFLQYFYKHIATPDTVFTGFNSIRFDDEFMRFLNYRNFYDAYEWQWSNGRSRWDVLDAVRMTRALRPNGIEWPFASDGKPANRLELLSAVNKLEHEHAHDALSDVYATIAVARLLRQKQPRLFEYLLTHRDKKTIQSLVMQSQPFVYTSGRYGSENLSTTVAVTVTTHPSQQGSVYVYDLRYDPENYIHLSAAEIAERLTTKSEKGAPPLLPIKQLQFNKCPAVAPLTVLDDESEKRLNLDKAVIEKNYQTLVSAADFADKLTHALIQNEKSRQSSLLIDINTVDSQLYDGFFNDADKNAMRHVRNADANTLADLHPQFADDRLKELLLLYKARQFPSSLSESEQVRWEEYKANALYEGGQQSVFMRYMARLQELAGQAGISKEQTYLLEELKLYAESIAPTDI